MGNVSHKLLGVEEKHPPRRTARRGKPVVPQIPVVVRFLRCGDRLLSGLLEFFIVPVALRTTLRCLSPPHVHPDLPPQPRVAQAWSMRFRSSALFECVLLVITFALGTACLVPHELRVSSGTPSFLKRVASWVGPGGLGWPQLVFPVCLAIRAAYLLCFDFLWPDIRAVLVWLRVRHDAVGSFEQHSPASRSWPVLGLHIVLFSGTTAMLLLVFPWSDSTLCGELQLPWLE